MNSSIGMPVANGAPLTGDRMERLFYLLSGCVLLVVVALGFQQFYLHGRANNGGPVTQQIAPLVFLHGILMSGWIVLFVAQSSLIVRGNRKLHMSLGVAGAVLAACLVVVGLATAIASVHYNPEEYQHIWGARRFLSLMLANILGFGVLAGIGLKYRRRPEVHRPMMLLATLFAAGPAGFFRIPWISGPVVGVIHTIFAVWVPMLALGILLLLLKWSMTRSFDRYVATGLIGIVLVCLVQFFVSTTALWYQIAGWVTA